MISSRIFNYLKIAVGVVVLISFWLFSRFTVDDAFIAWRYGKNLIDSGIWNYNPTAIDMTQAYTSPIYAILSIVPNYFGLDIVMFFKGFALLNLFCFIYYYIVKVKNSSLFLLLFFAVPASFVHLFGGMETFLFVSITVVFLISVYEDRHVIVITSVLFLFLIRPESWTLTVLLPTYYLLGSIKLNELNLTNKYCSGNKIKAIVASFDWQIFGFVFAILFSFLAAYFIFHYSHFGYLLPNTFYVKSNSPLGLSTIKKLIWYAFLIAPLILLVVYKNYRYFFLMASFFLSMAVVYASSSLQMDYVGRFAFHLFSPTYFFLIYFITKHVSGDVKIELKDKFSYVCNISLRLALYSLIIIYLGLFAWRTSDPASLANISDYYPRALDSHASLGKTINIVAAENNINAFVFSDAGMVAYHSNINALDNIGLGSSFVAHHGVTDDLLNSYKPEIVIFRAHTGGIHFDSNYQKTIYNWSKRQGLFEIGDVYWRPGYILRIYSKVNHLAFTETIERSYTRNNISVQSYSSHLFTPPWYYWKE